MICVGGMKSFSICCPALIVVGIVAAQGPPANTQAPGAVVRTPRDPIQSPASKPRPKSASPQTYTAEQIREGGAQFAAQCGFCHGRDATGGQSGPDLTDSELVAQDVDGDKISVVVKNGRPEKGMPPFTAMPETDLKKVVEFIHKRKTDVDANPGRRRNVSVADLSTGSADAGRAYFEGPGGCKTCHSATGDLVGVVTKYRGLALMQRMLYPNAGTANPPAAG